VESENPVEPACDVPSLDSGSDACAELYCNHSGILEENTMVKIAVRTL